jgi:hypothetical protein
MNHEQSGKLLKAQDSTAKFLCSVPREMAVFRRLRPDGGVVTQRTANPRPDRRFPPLLATFWVRSRQGISIACATIAKFERPQLAPAFAGLKSLARFYLHSWVFLIWGALCAMAGGAFALMTVYSFLVADGRLHPGAIWSGF